jgi:two-component system response regulator MprA
MPRVAVCEDDATLRVMLRRMLASEGHQVRAAATAQELAHFEEWQPAVVVLDVGLPDADGRDVCAALRSRGVGVGVLMLTAYDGVHNKVSGFHAGADDYLTKPFEVPELLARVEAQLRRRTPSALTAAEGRAPELELDEARHGVAWRGRRATLTPTEFRLLARLLRAPGEVVRRASLVDAGWPLGAMVSENSVDSYVRRLRRKLSEVGAEGRIETVRGVGYRWH